MPRCEREESSFGSGAVLAALGAWVMGGYVSSLPVPVDVETFTDRFIGTPAAQCLGWAVAILLIVPVIAKHVLAGYEAMERSRHRLGRERQVIIAFLQRIGVAFSTAPEQETVLGILLDSALETTEANAAAIYLFNAETQEYGPPVLRHFFPPLYVDTSSAYQEHHAGATEVLLAQAMQQRFALGQGVIGEVAKSGKPQLIEDVRQAGIVLGKTTQYFRDYSMLVTPLRVRDECLALEAFQRAMPEAVQTEAG